MKSHSNSMGHMDFLEEISQRDIRHLQEKEKTYKGSWLKRQGVGAWMMTCRKFDRLENILENYNYDIFAALNDDGNDYVDIEDDLGDLARYILLIRAEFERQRTEQLLKMDPKKYIGAEPRIDNTGQDNPRGYRDYMWGALEEEYPNNSRG